jgi:hypothetical protein
MNAFCSASCEGCELSLIPLGANFPGARWRVGQHKRKAKEGRTAGGMVCKAMSLHPIVLCNVGGLAENFFPDSWEVGYLASKDGQGNEEAV